MKGFLTILFFLTLNIKGFPQEVKPCYYKVDCSEFNLLIETKDVIIIDARFKKSYKKERIEGAFFVADKESLKTLLHNVDTTTHIMAYCVKGVRSKTICEVICEDLNFTNVYSLNKGFSGWKKEGYPTDKKPLKD